jgi:hypothetical protein
MDGTRAETTGFGLGGCGDEIEWQVVGFHGGGLLWVLCKRIFMQSSRVYFAKFSA